MKGDYEPKSSFTDNTERIIKVLGIDGVGCFLFVLLIVGLPFIMVLGILFGGEPDLMDAIIDYLKK